LTAASWAPPRAAGDPRPPRTVSAAWAGPQKPPLRIACLRPRLVRTLHGRGGRIAAWISACRRTGPLGLISALYGLIELVTAYERRPTCWAAFVSARWRATAATAFARGAVLAMLQGWIQNIRLRRGADRDRVAAGRLHARAVFRTSACSSPVARSPLERLIYRVNPVDPERTRLESPRSLLVCFAGLFWLALYLILSHARRAVPSTRRRSLRDVWDLSSPRPRRSSRTRTAVHYYGGETTVVLQPRWAHRLPNLRISAVGIVFPIPLIGGSGFPATGATWLGTSLLAP